jgi:hypothetical protein
VVQLIGASLNRVGRFDRGATPALDKLLTDVPIRVFAG